MSGLLRSGAFWLVVVIAAAVAWDQIRNDGAALIFLGREGLELLDWMAFWR